MAVQAAKVSEARAQVLLLALVIVRTIYVLPANVRLTADRRPRH
ncbi:hypothetical protein [Rhodococcus sp. NPDC060176]